MKSEKKQILLKGWTESFLFILRWMLTNLDLVVYRLRYYFINVLNGLKHFMTNFKIKPLTESKDSKNIFLQKYILESLDSVNGLIFVENPRRHVF